LPPLSPLQASYHTIKVGLVGGRDKILFFGDR
jgi:hypothetical protein